MQHFIKSAGGKSGMRDKLLDAPNENVNTMILDEYTKFNSIQ
jgi:hypothetical protein